jgi:GAF domain-containing protein
LNPISRARVIATKQLLHVTDYTQEAAYREGDPGAVRFVEIAGARTLLIVPMLREEALVGTMSIYRQEVRPFNEKQIELVKNFAAQAVIAIENTRLLNELRQRTSDLTESLEQQTAASEVLRVIASTQTDAQPAFEAMVARAARLCEADFSAVARFENGLLHLVALNNLLPAEREAFDSLFPRPPDRNFAMGRAFIDGVSVQFEDVLADPTYDPRTREVLQRTSDRARANIC